MWEKIDIDREGDEDGVYFSWIVCIVEIEYPPHTGYIASYRRVHKSRKERHSHDPDREISWIRPWSDRRMSLKYLHHHSNCVKYSYDPDLFPWLESCYDKKYLKYYSRKKEKVIPIKDSLERIVILRKYDHEDQKSSKYTSICLSIGENQEVSKEGSHSITIEKSYENAIPNTPKLERRREKY